jgi:hypothetical protein
MAKSLNGNGSESEFEFIETPKAPTPSFEKFEDCGVRTTSVSRRQPFCCSQSARYVKPGSLTRPT